MKTKYFCAGLLGAITLTGCALSTNPNPPPITTYDLGQNSSIVTYLVAPKANQTFAAGSDIPIEARARNFSKISRVAILVNGQRIAEDFRPPYTATISKAKTGTYTLYAVAYDPYGASKSSPGIVITVK